MHTKIPDESFDSYIQGHMTNYEDKYQAVKRCSTGHFLSYLNIEYEALIRDSFEDP